MTTPDMLQEAQAACETLKREVQELRGLIVLLGNGVCWCNAAFQYVEAGERPARHSDACELAGLITAEHRRSVARECARLDAAEASEVIV